MMAYNGWSNYETWNVMLWLDNDEPMYKEYRRQFRSSPATAGEIERFVRNQMPEGTPDFSDMGEAAAYDEVDWDEIANNINEDLHPNGFCESCGLENDKDCKGQPRCPDCDDPCPCCSDGPGLSGNDEEDEDEVL